MLTEPNPNSLWWLPLQTVGSVHGQETVVLKNHEILSCKELITEVFGDASWLEQFRSRAICEASTSYLTDSTIRAVCLVGRAVTYPCISSICVGPELRRKGLGDSLLKHSLKLLEEMGERVVLAHIREKNTSSRGLFRKAGFRQVLTERDLMEFGKLSGYLRIELASFLSDSHPSSLEQSCEKAAIPLKP